MQQNSIINGLLIAYYKIEGVEREILFDFEVIIKKLFMFSLAKWVEFLERMQAVKMMRTH